mgnify:CR=1 FL=1
MSKRRIIIRIPSGGAPPTPASTTGVGGSGGSSASPKRARIGDSGVGTTPALIQASIAVAGMEYWGGKGMGGCGVGGGGYGSWIGSIGSGIGGMWTYHHQQKNLFVFKSIRIFDS